VLRPRGVAELDELRASRVDHVLWPGLPEWAVATGTDTGARRTRLVADETLREIRRQIARAALEYVSRSNGVSARTAIAGSVR
jgi:hypothetical protein